MQKADTTALRLALVARLRDECAHDLAEKLEDCGQPVILCCLCCGSSKQVDTICKRKWCPSCQRLIAARRSSKFRNAVAAMEWPLFVTFTVRNSHDPESVKTVKKAFSKLRNRKFWKQCVRGGVSGLEVTNIGNGWHPHIHTVIDCKWLSLNVPAPTQWDSKSVVKAKCEAAHDELSAVWADCVGDTMANVWVKRAHGSSIVQEVLKYSIKGSDLLDSKEPVAPLIRVLIETRLVSSFGSLFGADLGQDEKHTPQPCDQCNEIGGWLPIGAIGNLDAWSTTKPWAS